MSAVGSSSAGPSGAWTAQLVQKSFNKDALRTIEHPKPGHETVVGTSGKITQVSHAKILKGDLAEFKASQEVLADSLDALAASLNAYDGKALRHVEGGNDEVKSKLFTNAMKMCGNDLGKLRQFTEDMHAYAAKLREAALNRRLELKTNAGIKDIETFRSQGVAAEQLKEVLQRRCANLDGVGGLAGDMLRYLATEGKVTIKGRGGEDMTPRGNNSYSVTLDFLEKAMVGLGMSSNDGGEFRRSPQAQEVLDRFNQRVASEAARGGAKDPADWEAGRFAEIVADFVRDLKGSHDPNLNKLAFALYGLHQGWVVGPFDKFGTISKDSYESGRFGTSFPWRVVNPQTKFEIRFEENGGVSLKVDSVAINRDWGERGEDFAFCPRVIARMGPDGRDPPEIDFEITLECRPDRAGPAQKFMEDLAAAGYEHTRIRGIMGENTPSQRQAIAANALIGAILSKDLNTVGIFRVAGNNEIATNLADELMTRANSRDPKDILLGASRIERLNLNDMVSALKNIMINHLTLVPEDRLEAFFSAADTEDPAAMRAFLATLPRENQQVIENLARLCSEVARLSDKNQMHEDNIATVLGVCLNAKAGGDLETIGKLREGFKQLVKAFPLQESAGAAQIPVSSSSGPAEGTSSSGGSEASGSPS